jgi:dihydroflavonol-4-reductase
VKVFLTGATGFVGSHVAHHLRQKGADLRLLVRPTSQRANLEYLNADLVTGDLRHSDQLYRAMQGCEVVFHIAADYRLWTRNPAKMYASNVDGTVGIIQAAKQAGVRRIVYTSSVATMGFGHAAEGTRAPVDEATPVSLSDMVGHYKRSKFMAEQKVLEAARAGINVVMVNPTTPIGEKDIKPTPTGRIVVDFLKRKFPAYVDTGLNLIDVSDCAEGHIAAMEHARPGERYILGGQNLSLKQILDKLAAITGLPSPTVKLPFAFAYGAAIVDTVVTGLILGREPRATIDAVRMGRKMMFVSSAKAERELHWTAGPVDDALRRAAEWFVSRGHAPAYAPRLVARA